MDTSNEKFFEELANRTPEGESGTPEYSVELTRAGNGTLPRAKNTQMREESDHSESEGQLTIDVYQTPSEIIVESAVAGVSPDDIDVDVTNDSITIKGRRYREKAVNDEDYFYQECYWGKFSRFVILPQEVDAERAYASFKNGILAVHLPKLHRQRAKKVKVRLE